MTNMAETAEGQDRPPGAAVARGILIGLPAGLIFMISAIWLITDLDLGDSLAAGLLPGVLFGVFAGGFAGMASSMD